MGSKKTGYMNRKKSKKLSVGGGGETSEGGVNRTPEGSVKARR